MITSLPSWPTEAPPTLPANPSFHHCSTPPPSTLYHPQISSTIPQPCTLPLQSASEKLIQFNTQTPYTLNRAPFPFSAPLHLRPQPQAAPQSTLHR
ncbi:unnamed protein product [Coffea canephora]|uniref:DH200=94 genomic scaffold, scaffold_88 n=1 Tax=Coffea canephora TaxID=49390 RepID=A0A068V214_COFCA|nr:unnamed protein product [Coffea canephora]